MEVIYPRMTTTLSKQFMKIQLTSYNCSMQIQFTIDQQSQQIFGISKIIFKNGLTMFFMHTLNETFIVHNRPF